MITKFSQVFDYSENYWNRIKLFETLLSFTKGSFTVYTKTFFLFIFKFLLNDIFLSVAVNILLFFHNLNASLSLNFDRWDQICTVCEFYYWNSFTILDRKKFLLISIILTWVVFNVHCTALNLQKNICLELSQLI